jgi:signal transduction histidine kinase/phage shock protein PspC (stress-responsive transcriptional regulator)
VTTATAHTPVRRDTERGFLGGVCAGLARTVGVDPILVRVLMVAAAVAGPGVPAYLLLFAFLPDDAGQTGVGDRLPTRRAWEVGAGIACLAGAALLGLRELDLWLGDALVWPTLLLAGGGALMWRQAQGRGAGPDFVPAPETPAAVPAGGTGRMGLRAVPGSLVGAALVVSGAFVFLALNDALAPARDVLFAVLAVVVALALILAPWWLRLVRGLAAERAERIRTEERSEIAAHLHDSVLQTLALVQRQAEDPRAVAQLARRQERELRAWLNGGRPPGSAAASFADGIELAAAEVEAAHGVAIEVVTVGDAPLEPGAEAVIAATREALTNAAKFGGGSAVSVFAEADPERLQVFVRDRGPGFDLATVPADRRGVRESIVGRLERAGGHAAIHAGPGQGTEVELTLERDA